MNNGLMTNVWGPTGWHFLHCVTFGYPIDPVSFNTERGLQPGEVQSNYKIFFESVGNILPCKYCRESYLEYIKELPLSNDVLKDRTSLVRWFYDIHNKVNKKLGVSEHDDFNCFTKRYERYRAKCSTANKKGCTTPLYTKMRTLVYSYPSELYWLIIFFLIVNIILISYKYKDYRLKL